MSSTLRSVRVVLSASTAGYIAEMKRAGAVTDSVAAGMTASGKKMSASQKALELGAKATKFAALGVAGGLVIAGKAAADYQAELALVQTLSHATAPEMKKLDDQARHTGQSWGFTATQVAQGQEELVKAGVSLKNILGGGLRGTLALAAAGQTDVATATEVAAEAMTQFKLKGKDVPHIADLLAAGADKALGSVTDLGDGLTQVGTTAHQMGFSIEETVGTLAEFAQAGLEGQRGGTVLNQMLLQLASPTSTAEALMKKYNLSLYDANGNIKTMSALAGNLQQSFAHLSPEQRNYALGVIFGSRAIRGANILLKDGAKANADWTKKVNDAGFAAQQASGKLDSLEGDWAKLKATTQTALIDIGSGATGSPLRKLVQGVTGDIKHLEKDGSLKRWGAEVSNTIQQVIRAAGPLAHEVGHDLSVVGHGVGEVVSGFNKLPHGIQQAIVTGGAVAYGAHKLGIDSTLKAAAKTVLGTGRGGLVGRAGVVPVVVTNWPPGFGVGGRVGAAEGAAAGLAIKGGVGGAVQGAVGKGALPGFGTDAVAAARSASIDRLFGRLGGFGAGIALGGMVPIGDAGNEVITPKALPQSRFDALQARAAAKAMRELGLSEQIVTEAGKGNAKAQAEVSAALGNQRKKINDLQNTRDGAWIAVNADKYKSLGKQIDSATNAYNTVKGAVKQAAQAHAEETGALETANRATAKYRQQLASLPPKVQTAVTSPGAVTSFADVRRLARQYDLTPRQVRTVIQLAGVSQAAAEARAYANQMAALNGRVATTYLRQVVQHVGTPTAIAGGGHPIYAGGSADGSTVPKTGRGYADRHLYALADGEEVVSNRHGQADRHRALLKAINANRLADGGTTGGIRGLAGGGTAFRVGTAAITVPIAHAANGWILDARNVAIAKALASAAQDITDANYQTLQDARATKTSRVDELHTLQSIRDTQNQLAGRHKKGKLKGQHTLTGLDRQTAQAELADYRHQLHDITHARVEAIKAANQQIRQQAIADQAQNRQDTMSSLTGSLDLLGETTSASRAVSLVGRTTDDIAQAGQIMAQLRSKGASPLLLQNLLQHAQSGDFRSVIRLGQSLLAQPVLLSQLNSSYGQMQQVAGSVATFASDPRFLGGGKWDPTGAAPKVVQVNIGADPTAWTRELQRVVKHEVQTELAKIG